MVDKLPYILATGLIPKILGKIQEARRPERFTQDFLETKLGHSGGSARAIIPLLKRLGLLASDGFPTPRYDQFRNPETQGIAIAEGMKAAFSELFERNEYVYEMPRDKLMSLVIEATGGTKDDRSTQAIVGTFTALNELADFESEQPKAEKRKEVDEEPAQRMLTEPVRRATTEVGDSVDFKVSYTINLNLPETTDPAVFDAIFRSLKENLLRE